jgi:hypothetical protein
VIRPLAVIAAIVFCMPAAPALAIPVFAHRYGLTCQVCHTEVPHLTKFGQAFLANGYRMRGLRARPAFPLAVRVETTYSSSEQNDDTTAPLPKTIVDEIEVLAGGSIGSRVSYWGEQYFVDGGEIGSTRDLWVADRLTPDGARTPVLLRGGQFTLPLPLDPETFRETTTAYAVWSLQAGINPFDFFTPKIGAELEIGDSSRAVGVTASVLKGHDFQSGLPTSGVDTMLTLERVYGNFSLNAYRYDGTRALVGYGFNNTQFFTGVNDHFWRNGFAAGYVTPTTEINAVYQIGNDTAADVYGDPLVTSGGFVQARQTLGKRVFALARWDATNGVQFNRSYIGGLGYNPSRNTRLTLFETVQRSPDTGTMQHIISSSFLFAY